jgi:hypothetical protein
MHFFHLSINQSYKLYFCINMCDFINALMEKLRTTVPIEDVKVRPTGRGSTAKYRELPYIGCQAKVNQLFSNLTSLTAVSLYLSPLYTEPISRIIIASILGLSFLESLNCFIHFCLKSFQSIERSKD